MVEKCIKEDQGKENMTSLVSSNDAASNPKKQAAPGPVNTDGSAGTTTTPKPDPKGGKKGGGKDTKGKGAGGKDPKGGKKGGGKGKDKDGGKSGNTPKANDATKKPQDPNRSCITNFFGKCKHGAHLGPGVKCDYGCHRKAPTDADRAHHFFKRMEAQHGTWEPGEFPYPAKANAAPASTGGAGADKGNGGVTMQTPGGSPRNA